MRIISELIRVIRKLDEPEPQKEVYPIDRFLTISREFAKDIKAAEQLGLTDTQERFFALRFGIHLFKFLWPTKAAEPKFDSEIDEKLFDAAKAYTISREVIRVRKDEDPCETSLNRAMDFAAKNAVDAIGRDIQSGGNRPAFCKSLADFITGSPRRPQIVIDYQTRTDTTAYPFFLRPQGQENLTWVFQRDGRDIQRFQQEVTGLHLQTAGV